MSGTIKTLLLLNLLTLVTWSQAKCSVPTPYFPLPVYNRQSSEIWESFSSIEASLSNLFRTNNTSKYNTSSFSIEVTSSQATLWSTFHTAREKNLTRPGAAKVDGTSRYRIASITKVFTVLGILQEHAAGNLSLDDTVDKYVPDLVSRTPPLGPGSSPIPWWHITLRSLASQLSGIPRDWAQGDLFPGLQDPTAIGLPPISEWADLPECDSYGEYRPCTAKELIKDLHTKSPLFAPNQKSTYSNIAFEILGIVLANVTGMSYEEYISTAVLDLVGMDQTSFSKPSDSVAVLPKDIAWYWDVDEGVQNPTGGLFCSSGDMSLFLRYVLQHYGEIASAGLNWFHPASFRSGLHSFYGMPWEIFRTERILDDSEKVVTLFTKGGGLPGYTTLIVLVPEYDLGITLFTAGSPELLDELQEMVIVPLIRAADRLVGRQVEEKYTGTFTAGSKSSGTDSDKFLNSSLTLKYTATHGLEITHWISNTTDMLFVIPQQFEVPSSQTLNAQMVPTLLFRDEIHKAGELWRIALTTEDKDDRGGEGRKRVSADFCTVEVDTLTYAGKPVTEVVFWDEDGEDGKYKRVELSAFRVNLTRVDNDKDSKEAMERLIVQDLQ